MQLSNTVILSQGLPDNMSLKPGGEIIAVNSIIASHTINIYFDYVCCNGIQII